METRSGAGVRIWVGGSAEAAERYRIAELVDRRDAVFPMAAGGAAEDVGGAWPQREVVTFPAFGRPASEAEGARGEKGDADHLVENRFVAVPADRRAGRVFGDQDVRQSFGIEARKGCGNVTQG